ncbi:hypothetical protein AVEN_90657-1 [Araneus ventricosus]|uniref:Uncharacterized protein n=1 Tax=Araneus ventricosus TaxID=182803 RepID=A0A4Y2WI17_ARAVE|nr:hypothetical protein AVEN_90657-1 [Araneus ventricosus]
MAKRERLFDTFKKTTSTFKLMMPSTDVLVIQESKSNLILSLLSCYIRPENFRKFFWSRNTLWISGRISRQSYQIFGRSFRLQNMMSQPQVRALRFSHHVAPAFSTANEYECFVFRKYWYF